MQTSDFLTINEKREAVGLEKYESPNADQIFIQSSLLPLDFEDTTGEAPTDDASKAAWADVLEGYSNDA